MENPLNSDDNEVRRRGRRIFSSLRKHADEPVVSPDSGAQENDQPVYDWNETTHAPENRPEENEGETPMELGSDLEIEDNGSPDPEPSPAMDAPRTDAPGGDAPVAETVKEETSGTDADDAAAASPAVIATDLAQLAPPLAEPEPVHDAPSATPASVDLAETVGEVPPVAPEEVLLELPRVVAITNQKGGVGKTTTSVNLGASLAELGYRVLVIDLDPQGNASTGMGVNPRSVEHSVYEVILHDLPIEDAIEPTAVRNLFCVPATIDLAGAEIELVPAMMREMRLKQAIDSVKEDYDWVLIDCPPSLGLLTVNGLAAANDVIVPIQCEYYALEGLGQLLRNVSLIQQRINPTLKVKGIVLTMFDARTRLAEQVESDVREHFGDTVYATVIPRTVRLSEAPSFGQPIIVFDPSSRGAVAYRDLAKEVARGATIGAR